MVHDTTPAPAPPAAGPRHRSPTILLTWATVAIVLVIVVVLVAVKLGSSTAPTTTQPSITPAPDTLVNEITSIPRSVYNQVGVDSPAVTITPPAAVTGRSRLTDGAKPVVFWYGAEYCPFCAADRWALIASLSRFGTFTDLGLIRSTDAVAPPGIESFTFRDADFSSPYVMLQSVEARSDYNPTGAGFTTLQNPDAAQSLLLASFHVSSSGYPFVDFGNVYDASGVSYSPTFLSGLTWDQIGASLRNPDQPVTRAIVALSNYFSAATCAADGQAPRSVCHSKGVTEAARAMDAAK